MDHIQKMPVIDKEKEKKIKELLWEEQVIEEKRITIISLVIILFVFVAIMINAMSIYNHVATLMYVLGYGFLVVYKVFIYFILKKKIYHTSIKFITSTILVSVITYIFFIQSSDTGWIYTVLNPTIIGYCCIVMMTGLYQNPKVPIFTAILTVVAFLFLLSYALFTKRLFLDSYIAELPQLLKILFCFGLITTYVPLFLFCGFNSSIITKRMYNVLSRALFSEADEKVNKQKIDFFLNLAHEVKTPLTLIGNYLDTFISLKGRSREAQIIEKNFNKLKNDIINFLDMEKLARGQVFYNHDQATNISEMLSEKIEMFEDSMYKKKIHAAHSIEPGLFTKIDPFAADRVINNLIDNAVKFTRENDEVSIGLKAADDKIFFEVKDSGIGIPEDKQKHIFEPYFQISVGHSNIEGLGLGLSIVKKIIDEIKAEISLKSIPGEGSTFTIIFQRDLSSHVPGEQRSIALSRLCCEMPDVELKAENYSKEKPVILLVEDNIELLAFLQENLIADYSVYYALNGKQALAKLITMPPPSIIISDIMMDEMDGFEFYAQFSSKPNGHPVPFIFLTARTDEESKIKGLSFGAIDYICKPFSIGELKLKISAILKNIDIQKEWQKEEIKKKIVDQFISRDESGNQKKDLFDAKCREYSFSKRETEVAVLLSKGLSYKEIASTLFFSEKTASTHIQRIYEKTGTTNKMDFLKAMNLL
jgi:signal transduction histidine kinase/DNA-binding NarL/FixJ family response regulator